MNVTLSHQSALQFWLKASPHVAQALLEQQAQRLPRARFSLSQEEAVGLSSAYGLSLPLQAITLHADRRSDRFAKTHYSSALKSQKLCFEVAEGLHICCPELAFSQIATDPHYSILELIWICHLLCGIWMPAENEWGQEYRPALMSPRSLLRLCGSDSSIVSNRAEQAAKLTCANAASAGEVALAMTSTLSHHLGGLNVFRPSEVQLNPEINVDKAGETRRKPDILIPSINLALEYDGERAHSGQLKYAQDAGRRIELAASNVQVLTVTKLQLFDDDAMDLLARTICRRLKRKYRPRGRQYFEKRHELQRFLNLHMDDPLQCLRLKPKRRAEEDEASEP